MVSNRGIKFELAEARLERIVVRGATSAGLRTPRAVTPPITRTRTPEGRLHL